MAGLVLALLAPTVGRGAGAQGAPTEPPPRPTVEIDPVLDEVPVVEGEGVATADRRYDDAAAAEGRAVLAWLAAEQVRADLVDSVTGADARIVDAEAALVVAQDQLRAEEATLQDRRTAEGDRRRELDAEQDELRRLAASVTVSGNDDAFAWLGEPDNINAYLQRNDVRVRTTGEQIRRVDERTVPWEDAVVATADQEEVVTGAAGVVLTATTARDGAIDERDRYAQLLTAAVQTSADRLTDLQTSRLSTEAARLDRRTARLTARVAGTDLPLVALDAYWRAAGGAPCAIPWWVLAGVGRVESGHGSAHGSSLAATGDTTVRIVGIPLDGRPGVAAIADTDGGRLDADGRWDRAVGPMQFIPGTWNRWQSDGNADGLNDPHNIYDAAAAAARYLCFGRGDLTTEPAIRGALLSYNQSVPYGSLVLYQGDGYHRAIDLPDRPAPSASPVDGG